MEPYPSRAWPRETPLVTYEIVKSQPRSLRATGKQ